MATECNNCGATGPLHGATITDHSGGSFVAFCPDCWADITPDRCAVCGQIDDGRKADAIHPDNDGPPMNICDDCRLKLIDGRRATNV